MAELLDVLRLCLLGCMMGRIGNHCCGPLGVDWLGKHFGCTLEAALGAALEAALVGLLGIESNLLLGHHLEVGPSLVVEMVGLLGERPVERLVEHHLGCTRVLDIAA